MYVINSDQIPLVCFTIQALTLIGNFVVYYMYFRILSLGISFNNIVFFHLILNVSASPIVAICSDVGDNLRAWATMGQCLSSKINFLYGRSAKENYWRIHVISYFSPFSAPRVCVNLSYIYIFFIYYVLLHALKE